MAQDQPTRREVLKGAVYVTPAILTLAAVPAFASSGSGRPGKGDKETEKPKGKGGKTAGDKETEKPKGKREKA